VKAVRAGGVLARRAGVTRVRGDANIAVGRPVENYCKEKVISLEAKEVIKVVCQLKVPSPFLAAMASTQPGYKLITALPMDRTSTQSTDSRSSDSKK
jgi:hypothetical protein